MEKLAKNQPQEPQNQTQICQEQAKKCRKGPKELIQKQKRWNLIENQKYSNFLFKYSSLFQTQYLRRTNRVFKKLSAVIKTKNPNQCKSHHQKMCNRYTSIDKIVSAFYSKIQKVRAQEKKKKGFKRQQKQNGLKKEQQEEKIRKWICGQKNLVPQTQQNIEMCTNKEQNHIFDVLDLQIN